MMGLMDGVSCWRMMQHKTREVVVFMGSIAMMMMSAKEFFLCDHLGFLPEQVRQVLKSRRNSVNSKQVR